MSTGSSSSSRKRLLDVPMSDEEEADAALDWRGDDPKATFSDWTIKIIGMGEDGTTVESVKEYHIHRTVLAVGPRRSKYFTGLFHQTDAGNKNNLFTEAKDQVSIIEMPKLAADTFPLYLDYSYRGINPKCLSARPTFLDLSSSTSSSSSSDNDEFLLRQPPRRHLDVSTSSDDESLSALEPHLDLSTSSSDDDSFTPPPRRSHQHGLLALGDSSSQRLLAVEITGESANPLYYLADRFDNASLRRHIKQFMRHDLCFANAHVYYKHAKILITPFVHDLVVNRVAYQHGKTLKQRSKKYDPRIYKVAAADTRFWMDVLELHHKETEEDKRRHNNGACRLVQNLCVGPDGESNPFVDADTFLQLTSEKYIPEVSSKYVFPLLMIEERLVPRTADARATMTSLQSRSITGLAKMDWNELKSDENVRFIVQFPALMEKALPRFISRAEDTEAELLKSTKKRKRLRKR